MKQSICTKCTNQISINDNDIFVACPKCFSYQEVTENGLKFLSSFKNSNRPKEVCFDLGQNIKVNGTNYTITGITQRNDGTNLRINWREYVLNDELNQERFLNEYNGNWQLVWALKEKSPLTGDYNLFQKYYQDVNWAVGNFNFDVVDTNRIYSKEYIYSPKILIEEVYRTSNGKESNSEWYEGEYVDNNEIYQEYLSLGNTTTFPSKIGVGATEPYKSQFYLEDAKKMSLIALAVILAIQLYFMAVSPTRTVFKETFSLADLKYDSVSTFNTTPKPFVSKSFTIEKTGKIELELVSSVDNSWLESNITLINESTLEELPVVMGNEYYHGVEGGESWTEGSTSASKDYSSVPAGKYHLLVETSSPNIAGTYSVSLKTGGIYWTNIVILFCLILIVPIVKYFQQYSFEKERWADSDYSPYITEEE